MKRFLISRFGIDKRTLPSSVTPCSVSYTHLSGLTKFKISDIVYGIAQGRYLKIYMLDGSEHFITDKGVSQLYEMLKDMNFARISRSVIINFENVNTIGDEIIMTDGVKLKSSRRMKKQKMCIRDRWNTVRSAPCRC